MQVNLAADTKMKALEIEVDNQVFSVVNSEMLPDDEVCQFVIDEIVRSIKNIFFEKNGNWTLQDDSRKVTIKIKAENIKKIRFLSDSELFATIYNERAIK